jgi:MFS family permease
MLTLALVLYALARFSSPALAGWLTFAAVVPGLMMSPVAGAFLDMRGPVRAVLVDMGASAALILALACADMAGIASPPLLIVLVALYSLTGPLGAAGVRTLLPSLVPAGALDRANAVDTAIHAVADVAGPGAAGLLVAFAGPSWALAAVALVYAAAAICIATLPRVDAATTIRVSLFGRMVEGVAIVLRQPTLRGLALSYSLYQVTWGMLVIAVPVLVARHFPAQGSFVAGFVWSAMGVTGGFGALAAGHLRTTGRERQVMAAGMVVTALAAWPVAAELGFAGLVLGMMIAGTFAGPVDVGLLTLRQRRTSPTQLGRVLSISMSLNIAGFPLGSAIAGVLITASLPAAFVMAALASVAGAVATLAIPND